MMDFPLPGADPDVSEVVLEYLDYLVARDAPRPLRSKSAFAAPYGTGSIPGFRTGRKSRKAMGMSESTLRRRLHDRGLSYTDILTEVRCDLARQLLVTTRQSLTEIAYSAGFSASSAFTRSFMHWHGETALELPQTFTPGP